MGTGWRRAFCTTIPKDREVAVAENQSGACPSPSPRSACAKLGFLSGGSNPSTPRLQSSQPVSRPSLRCRTSAGESTTGSNGIPERITSKTMTPRGTKSPRPGSLSNPVSPRSPLKLSLFRNSFKFRSSCGVCLNSVKTGQGKAIFTAECSHAFHFPCIADHVRKLKALVCPVCNTTWQDVPLLTAHKNLPTEMSDSVPTTPKVEDKRVIGPYCSASPRATTTVFKSKPAHARSYDDDEPLVSPTAGVRFVTIPERDEEAESEDVEEFQGFVVNPHPSFSVKSQVNSSDFKSVQVKLLPESAVVSSCRAYETRAVALRVKAPSPRNGRAMPFLDPSQRAPIDLVTVLDLNGPTPKLEMVKRAVRLVIGSLGSGDRLSIVSSSKRLLPLKRMTERGKRVATRVVDALAWGQGGGVGHALRKAVRVLEDRRERNPVSSVVVLSDGGDETVGFVGTGSSHVATARFVHVQIPVHESGLGKCLSGLLSVVVQDLRIQLGVAFSSAPCEISAVYLSINGRPTAVGSGSIRLGDLYAGEERELLVELRVPASELGSDHMLSVRCLYKDPATQEVVYGKDQGVPVPHAIRSSDPKIQRLRNIFITSRALAESRRLMEHNDCTSAYHLLSSSRALLMQSATAEEELVRVLEAELAELQWLRQEECRARRGGRLPRDVMMVLTDENGEPLTPSSAWRAAEKLAKVAMMKKPLNSDLHGFENARF